jgi:glucose/mannose transport system permease protein
MFEGNRFDRGTAIATLLLLGISVVIVPYIWYSVRTERRK